MNLTALDRLSVGSFLLFRGNPENTAMRGFNPWDKLIALSDGVSSRMAGIQPAGTKLLVPLGRVPNFVKGAIRFTIASKQKPSLPLALHDDTKD